MQPYLPPDLEEFMRVCAALIPYLTDQECEEVACVMYFVRQKTVRPNDEVDDLTASIAFSKLPSIG
jgi:tRNA A58 N-methylase Trm61